jgi:1-acyl-sn-glycerol-3-phosphate acyltransferase
MNSEYHLPWYNKLARKIIIPIFRLLFNTLSHVEVSGLENIPVGQPYLMVFNHVSLYEAPILVSHWPESLEVLGAKDVWERPGQNLLANAYGGIPIYRGEVDRTAMYKMLAVLQSGRPLLIAPEGTRSHKPGMQAGKPGIAFVYEKLHVPFVPVGMIGTTEDFLPNLLHFRKPTVKMVIGPAFMLPTDLGAELKRSEAYQVQVDYVMRKIAALLPEEYRGMYA